MNKRHLEKRIGLISENDHDNKHIKDTEYLFLLKKTEKIIIAVYIISDFIPPKETLKKTLKDNSHLLLDSVSELFYSRKNRINIVQKIKASLIKLTTQFGLAEISGFISKMNSDVIKDEINNLIKIIDDFERELIDEQPPEFKQTQFFVDIRNKRQYTRENKEILDKGHDKGQLLKIDKNVFYNPIIKTQNNKVQKNLANDNAREEKILGIIRQKGSVSIKDISSQIFDCSEKTIQRTLNKLIEEQKITKTGERRWAKYSF